MEHDYRYNYMTPLELYLYLTKRAYKAAEFYNSCTRDEFIIPKYALRFISLITNTLRAAEIVDKYRC